ncbi:MAG: hypothetical protein D6B25_18305 [Desulfobulbaceae bacterium]|nr:MAG: hypothetical protein D6B25_18305 [Desulfobulbaceae bacterium]
MSLKLVKVGGSVISRESSTDKYESGVVKRIARELQPYKQGLVLVHGTGYVGKPPAIAYGYYQSGLTSRKDALAMLGIKQELRLLNHRFCETMLEQGIPIMPFGISHLFTPEMDRVEEGGKTELTRVISNGFVPVFYGDLILCDDGCFKVFSSDIITLLLSQVLQPEKVLFLSDVAGVFNTKKQHDEPETQSIINELTPEIAASLEQSGNDQRDVSGGMSAKIGCAFEISSNAGSCFIGSGNTPGIIDGFMQGQEVVGTYIRT